MSFEVNTPYEQLFIEVFHKTGNVRYKLNEIGMIWIVYNDTDYGGGKTVHFRPRSWSEGSAVVKWNEGGEMLWHITSSQSILLGPLPKDEEDDDAGN